MAAITQAVKTIAGLFARPFAAVHGVLFWQIVLQKSFSTRDQKFSGL